jgi:Flp pilus assembly protein TadD
VDLISIPYQLDCNPIIYNSAVAKLGQGYAEESLEYLYPVINCHCIDADIYILRAKIYCQLGSVFLAIQDLRIAMDLNPGHPEISWLQFKVIEYAVDFKNKASEQILRNDFKTAIWFLNQAIELDPDDWKTLMIRGILLGEIDQYEAGITDLLQVLGNIQRKDDKEEDIKHYISILHNKAGVNFFDERQFSAALERFEIALNFNPDDILIRKNRAGN